MRVDNLPVPKDLAKMFSPVTSLELFRRMCLCRNFEMNVKQAFDLKLLPKSPLGSPIPFYLSLGQESVSAALSLSFPDAYQFAQHRAHDLYLCYGGSPQELKDELLGLPTGCAKGMGGSASIHSPRTRMCGHDGLMGTQIPIAVGYALGSGNQTLAIMGDASAEEGYVIGSMGEAVGKKAPVLFVCIDNNLSILTEVKVRRNWTMADEARAKGMLAFDIIDDPWLIMHHVERVKDNLPAFLNIHTCRELWHAFTGCDGPPEWRRFELVREELISLGFGLEVSSIEEIESNHMTELWALPKRSNYDRS